MKILRCCVVLPSLLWCLNVYAIGLGPLKVHSRLNQPMDASVSINGLKGTSLGDVNVRLARTEEYRRIDVEPSPEVEQLVFSVEKNAHGKPIIHITSLQPVSNPAFELVLNVNSGDGQLLKSYSVMLDPPEHTIVRHRMPRRPQAPVEINGRGPNVPPASAIPYKKHIQPLSQLKTQTQTQKDTRFKHKVMPSEKLWTIAKAVRTDKSQPINDVIHAIVSNNPHAFINGDANRMLTGMTLSLPRDIAKPNAQQTQASNEPVPTQNALGDFDGISLTFLSELHEKTTPNINWQPKPVVDEAALVAQQLTQPSARELSLSHSVAHDTKPFEHEAKNAYAANALLQKYVTRLAKQNNLLQQVSGEKDKQYSALQARHEALQEKLENVLAQGDPISRMIKSVMPDSNLIQTSLDAADASIMSTNEITAYSSDWIQKLLISLLIFVVAAGILSIIMLLRKKLKPVTPLGNGSDWRAVTVGDDVYASKLDMAVAYINMDDVDAAQSLLQEILENGDAEQQREATNWLNKMKT